MAKKQLPPGPENALSRFVRRVGRGGRKRVASTVKEPLITPRVFPPALSPAGGATARAAGRVASRAGGTAQIAGGVSGAAAVKAAAGAAAGGAAAAPIGFTELIKLLSQGKVQEALARAPGRVSLMGTAGLLALEMMLSSFIKDVYGIKAIGEQSESVRAATEGLTPESAYYQGNLEDITAQRQMAQRALMSMLSGGVAPASGGGNMGVPGVRQIGGAPGGGRGPRNPEALLRALQNQAPPV